MNYGVQINPCSFLRGFFFTPFFSFYVFTLLPATAFSQDYLLLQKEAQNYYNDNDLKNALVSIQSALEYAEVSVGKQHIEYAYILKDAGYYNAEAGNFMVSLEEYEEATELFRKYKGDNSEEYHDIKKDLGSILYYSGENTRAEQLYLQETESDKKLYGEESEKYAASLVNLAQIQQFGLNKLQDAEKNLFQCKRIYEKMNMTGSNYYASVLNNIANLFQSNGDYLKAEKYYKDAARLYKKNEGEKSQNYVNCIQNMGLLYIDMGRLDESEILLLKALELNKTVSGEESYGYSVVLSNLAELYGKTGNYAEAEKIGLRSIQIKEKAVGVEHSSYQRSVNDLALLYKALGRTEEALALMQQIYTRTKMEKISNPLAYAVYTSNLAGIYYDAKEDNKAILLYKEVIEIYLEQYGESFGDYSSALSNLASVYLRQLDRKSAKELLLKAMKIAMKSNKYYEFENLEVLNNFAMLCQLETDYKEAEKILKDVLKIAGDYYGISHPVYNFFLFNMGIIFQEQSKEKEAEDAYVQVIETDLRIMQNYFSFMSETEKGAFYSTAYQHFNTFYQFSIDRAKKEPAVLSKIMDYRLATKSMLLAGANQIRNHVLSGKDSLLINLYRDWKLQKEYLLKLYSLPKRELALLKADPDSMERSVNELEKRISGKLPFSARQLDIQTTWKQVQSNLQPDEATIEIIRVNSAFIDQQDKVFYMAIIIDKNLNGSPKFTVMEDGYEMETQYCKQYHDAISDTTKKENTYEHFWKKIEQQLNGVHKVYFSADGIYQKINLNSIWNPNTRSYLIDNYDFYYVSSLRDLIGRKDEVQKAETNKSITLFGFPDYTSAVIQSSSDDNRVSADYLLERKSSNLDRSFYLDPLPGTRIEVENIAKMMKEKGWKTDMFLAKNAQEEKLKSLVNPTVLHIATHGYFQKDIDQKYTPATSKLAEKMVRNPLLCSGLMLAGASNAYNVNYSNAMDWTGREDGILTAYEAMNLNLDKTELVVLSACETGLGEIHNGEGVYGLQRAFMVAGAKTVIMSLWTVSDDATQKLMTLFYSRWLETGDKHGAFRYAQLELKKIFPDPYFWSAFVIIGE